MRALLSLSLLASVMAFGPAEAQQRKPAPKAPAAAAPAEPAAPPIFPCRTMQEVCYLGVVVGSQVAVLYTNAENAAGDPTPVDVSGPDGQKIDMTKDAGKVVMLTGTLDPKAGIQKAEIVEVASPLASLAIKAQLAGGGEEPPAPAPKGGGAKRR